MFYDQEGNLFTIQKDQFLKIKEASLEEISFYLLDENPLVRMVANQRLATLKKERNHHCLPLNPSKTI